MVTAPSADQYMTGACAQCVSAYTSVAAHAPPDSAPASAARKMAPRSTRLRALRSAGFSTCTASSEATAFTREERLAK